LLQRGQHILRCCCGDDYSMRHIGCIITYIHSV
jgi:hypothetical protein